MICLCHTWSSQFTLSLCVFLFSVRQGEKLSKTQLQHTNIIKKLRVKEKESEAKITKQQKKIKEQEDELKQLLQVKQNRTIDISSLVTLCSRLLPETYWLCHCLLSQTQYFVYLDYAFIVAVSLDP